MKKIIFALMLIWSVSLFSNMRDTCIVVATIEADFMQHIYASNNSVSSSIVGPVTAYFTGIVVPSATGTFSVTITVPVSGTINGTLTGIIAGNITNPVTGSFNGTFTGTGSGVVTLPGHDMDIATGDITGIATGVVICDEPAEETSCRDGLKCNSGNIYGIRVCNYDAVPPKLDTLCIKNLEDLNEIPLNIRPRIVLDMPICIEFDYATFPGSYSYYQPFPIMDEEGIKEDIENAVNEWNCLCDFDKVINCKKIKASFSDNKTDFPWGEREFLAKARTISNGSSCDINNDSTSIMFNNTSFFRYQDSFDVHSGLPIWSFINKKYEYLLEEDVDYGNIKIFSFYDVMLHEFGHALGFIHSDVCGDGQESNMNEGSVANNPNRRSIGLSDYDKCMFMTFYCPGFIGIYDMPVRPIIIITPNPTTGELNVTFEIKEGMKTARIQICNEEGQILETLLPEDTYSEGMHNCSAKLNYPSGAYFILIKIDNVIYSDKIIIAK